MKEGAILQNRYKLVQTLGKGSMGEVFLAEDLREKTSVALKIFTQRDQQRYFKEEFRLLSELDHPNLAPVYDFGVLAEGPYFFTMEYVDGDNFWDATEERDYEQLTHFTVQICRVLEYLHSKNYIHCDIKPNNILINREGTVKLLDFGLVTHQRTDIPGRIRGTLAYMAPEMARGESLDHRADLYSLGMVLYHIVTRQVPFSGKSALGLIKKHIHELPQPPGELVEDLPPLWEKTIHRLGAKEPADRYQSANEVILEINRNTSHDFPLETRATLKSYITSSKIVGRNFELDRFQEIYQDHFAPDEERDEKKEKGESPSLVILSGGEGMGKSRLLREYKCHVQLNETRAMWVEIQEAATGPFEPFREIIETLVDKNRPEDIPDEFHPYLQKLLRTYPTTDVRHSELKAERESLRFYHKISEFLVWQSQQEPYTVFIDNLEHADSDVVEMVKYLAKLAPPSLLITLTVRSDDPIWSEFFQGDQELERRTEVIELSPLGEMEQAEVIDSMFPLPSRDREILLRAVDPYGGTPLLIKEFIKALVEEEVILYIDGRWDLQKKRLRDFEIPKEITPLLERRFYRMDDQPRQILQTLAVINRPVPREILAEVTDLSLEEITEILHQLQGSRIIYEDLNQPQFYKLASQKITQVLLSTISEERELHLKIARALEAHYQDRDELPLEELAHHLMEGGEVEEAVGYFLRAGDEASRVYAYARAGRHYQTCLSLLPSSGEKYLEVLGKLAQLHYLTGDLKRAVTTYQQLLEQPNITSEKQSQVYQELGNTYQKMGRYANALDCYRRSLQELGPMAVKQRVELLADSAWVLARQGKCEEAMPLVEEGFALIEVSDSGESSKLYTTLTSLHYYQGELQRAAQQGRRALEIRKREKVQHAIAAAHNNLAVIYKEQGDFDQAIHHFEQALAISEEISDFLLTSSALNNLGSLYQERGEFDLSLDLLKQSLNIKLKIGTSASIAGTLNNIGYLLFRKADYASALEYYNSCLKIEEEVGDHHGIALTLNNLADLYLEVGMNEEAKGFLDRAYSIAKTYNIPVMVAYCQRLLAKIDLARSTFPPAQQRLEDAVDILEEHHYGNQASLAHLELARLGYLAREPQLAQKALARVRELVTNTQSKIVETMADHLEGLLERDPHRRMELWEKVEHRLETMSLPELSWQNDALLAREREGRGELKKALFHYRRCLRTMKEIYERLPINLQQAFVARPDRKRVRDSFIHLNSRLLAQESDFFFEGSGPSSPTVNPTLQSQGGKRRLPPWELILQTNNLINAHVDNYSQTLHTILESALELGQARGGFVLLINERNRFTPEFCLEMTFEQVRSWLEEHEEDLRDKLTVPDPCLQFISRSGRPLYAFPLRRNLYLQPLEKLRDRRSLPEEAFETIGILVLLWGEEEPEDAQKEGLQILASQATTAIINSNLYREATADSLTPAMNRLSFEKKLHLECQSAQRTGSFLSLAFIDIVDFSEFNHRYGYSQGDRVLHEVAQQLLSVIRHYDTLGRYSADVFAVLLPQTNSEQAHRCVEKLCEAVEMRKYLKLPIKVRVGFATFPVDSGQTSELVNRAKQALVAAKEKDTTIERWNSEFATITEGNYLPSLLPPGSSTRFMGMLMEVKEALRKEHDRYQNLRLIMDMLVEATGLKRAILYLPEGDSVNPVLARDHQRKEIEPTNVSDSLPRRVLETQETLFLLDAGRGQYRKTLSMDRFSIKTVLCLPIGLRDVVLGVMYLDSFKRSKHLREEDIPQLELLANQAAILIYEGEEWMEETPSSLATILYAVSEKSDRGKFLRRQLHTLYQFGTYLRLERMDLEDLLLATLKLGGIWIKDHPDSYASQIYQEIKEGRKPLSYSARLIELIDQYLTQGKSALDKYEDKELSQKFHGFLHGIE